MGVKAKSILYEQTYLKEFSTFSYTNSLKEQQNGEQSTQNNFWSLAPDIRHPEKQPIVFDRR